MLCGGEPTLHHEIENIAIELKKMAYKIKLDTNGTKPKVVKKLIKNHLVDYVALDFKAPKEKFEMVTNVTERDQMSRSGEYFHCCFYC